MKYKLKKYLKFCICFIMILLLTMHSFAALSAADGSIFVTKSEFDSTMIDVSSRLSTFEAGINSKIDAQVTSFLDRNGIWNPVEQNFRTDNITADDEACLLLVKLNDFKQYDNGHSLKAGDINHIGFLGILMSGQASYWRRYPSMKYAIAQIKIVENISKSGLCMASLRFSQNVFPEDKITSSNTPKTNITLKFSSSGDGSTNQKQKWFAINQFLTQQYMTTTTIPTGTSHQNVPPDECYEKLPSDTFGLSPLMLPEMVQMDYATYNKTMTPPTGTYTFIGFVKQGSPLYYTIGMIGAQVDRYGITSSTGHHPRSLAITKAKITVY